MKYSKLFLAQILAIYLTVVQGQEGPIPADDDDLNNEAPAPEKSSEEKESERKELMNEWETHMQEFVPDEMLTFDVESKTQEVFYEEIEEPTNIRGAYFVTYMSSERIDFRIIDPKNETVFQKFQRREGIFSYDAQLIGEYKFIFDNRKGKQNKAVTFAIDVRNTTQEHLTHKHLDPLEKDIEHLTFQLRDFHTETKFASLRQESHAKAFKETHNKLLIISVIEIFGIIAASTWQIYYIKKILDNRRII